MIANLFLRTLSTARVVWFLCTLENVTTTSNNAHKSHKTTIMRTTQEHLTAYGRFLCAGVARSCRLVGSEFVSVRAQAACGFGHGLAVNKMHVEDVNKNPERSLHQHA
eukprot:scaffold47110_cov36-Attheya_sp.AAC.1